MSRDRKTATEGAEMTRSGRLFQLPDTSSGGVINWNRLPEHSVTSTLLNMFKNKLGRHLWERWGLNEFLNKIFSPVWPPGATADGGIW